jgi:hypothetical protein
MRFIACFLVVVAVHAGAEASGAPAGSAAPLQEGLAVGLLATPAREGGGPWFLPAVRVSAPLGAKRGVDFDAGRIFGGSNKYADIRRFYAGQFRFRRADQEDAMGRYWLVGLMFMSITKLDGQGGVRDKKPYAALSIGHGWNQAFPNGTRAVSELGFSGGEGFMVYATIGVQWGPPRRD